MNILPKRALLAATALASIGLASLALAPYDTRSETACNADTVRDRLAKLEAAFSQPKMQAKLSAAQKDWQEDNDFDDPESAKYLGTVGAYLSIKRNFDGGSTEGACEILIRTEALVQSVLSD
jgi:hypothetical protein